MTKPQFEIRTSDFIGYVLNQIPITSQVNKEVKVEIHINGPHGFLTYSQGDHDYNNGVFFKMGSLDCGSITWGRHQKQELVENQILRF